MTSPLRDPRSFRVRQHPERPNTPGGFGFVKSDELLEKILHGSVPGEIPAKEQENYYPGQIIPAGRVPAHLADLYVARGVLEVVETKTAKGGG